MFKFIKTIIFLPLYLFGFVVGYVGRFMYIGYIDGFNYELMIQQEKLTEEVKVLIDQEK